MRQDQVIQSDRPILELLDQFLAEKDVKANSRKNYKRTITIFINWMVRNRVDIKRPSRADILLYKAWLLDENHPPNTVDSYLTSVRQWFAWMEQCGIYTNIAAGINSPKRWRGFSKDHLKPTEVNTLIASIGTDTLLGLRDRAMIALMATMGLRACEVSNLELNDIIRNSAGNKLKVLGKGQYTKERVVGDVPLYVMQMIDKYITMRDDATDMNVFSTHRIGKASTAMTTDTLSRVVRLRLRSCGLKRKRITCHSLRHTAAVTALQAGATIEQVKAMLGHQNIETTMIYTSSIEAELTSNNGAVRAAAKAYDISA